MKFNFGSKRVKLKYSNVNNDFTVNSEDLFQPRNAKLAPEAPGADAAHCGAISATAGTKLTQLKADTAHSGTQFGPLVPAPVNYGLEIEPSKAPKMALYFTHRIGPISGAKTEHVNFKRSLK